MTNPTKKSRISYYLWCVLSFICSFGPLLYYTVAALFSPAGLLVSKVALVGAVAVVLILTMVALVNKMVFRSRIFILLLGLYLCLESIIMPILLVGIGQIVDELVVAPAKANAKTRLIANKTYDKREAYINENK